jgi:hypothetical protein
MKCPVPKPSSILTTAAARTVPCGADATVMADVPMKNPHGEPFMQRMMICLSHAINLAVWKLTLQVPAAAADPERILLI